MPVGRLKTSFARIFFQRCFYLFVSLIALMVAAPFLADTVHGRLLVHAIQVLVLLSAMAAAGRTRASFSIALLLGIPALVFQVFANTGEHDPARWLAYSWAFYLAFYGLTIVYLLRYVFSPEVMTDDKLFGAASAYLMFGIAWAAAYALMQYSNPEAFGAKPGEPPRTMYDLIYMSFGLLSSNGPGDIVPTGARVRMLVTLEQVTGVLFVAILIARLAGIYPPKKEPGE